MTADTISYRNNRLRIIDQRALPRACNIIEIRSLRHAHECIKTLAVRGAPAIGVFASYSVLIGLESIMFFRKAIIYNRLS
jgi:methylthioribose-1-phosphate isomerase